MRMLNICAVFLLILAGVNSVWAAGCFERKEQYVIHDETVYDKSTNLKWMRCSVGQTWNVGSGCTGTPTKMPIEVAMQLQKDGWRVPSIDELKSLLITSCPVGAMFNTEVFPSLAYGIASESAFWTSTRYDHGSFWVVSFRRGDLTADGQSHVVRLVRDGKNSEQPLPQTGAPISETTPSKAAQAAPAGSIAGVWNCKILASNAVSGDIRQITTTVTFEKNGSWTSTNQMLGQYDEAAKTMSSRFSPNDPNVYRGTIFATEPHQLKSHLEVLNYRLRFECSR